MLWFLNTQPFNTWLNLSYTRTTNECQKKRKRKCKITSHLFLAQESFFWCSEKFFDRYFSPQRCEKLTFCKPAKSRYFSIPATGDPGKKNKIANTRNIGRNELSNNLTIYGKMASRFTFDIGQTSFWFPGQNEKYLPWDPYIDKYSCLCTSKPVSPCDCRTAQLARECGPPPLTKAGDRPIRQFCPRPECQRNAPGPRAQYIKRARWPACQ